MQELSTRGQSALDAVFSGLPVIPLWWIEEDGTCACGNTPGRFCSPGKHPISKLVKSGIKDATDKPQIVRKWWGQYPEANIGGQCGDWLCLDVDIKRQDNGFKSLEYLESEFGDLPKQAVVLSGEKDGKRGMHVWFRMPDGKTATTRPGLRKGVDLKGEGGYALLPPSNHASGVSYEWERGHLDDAPSPPDWLLTLMPEHVPDTAKYSATPKHTPMKKETRAFLSGRWLPDMGEQTDWLTKGARALIDNGSTVEEATEALWALAERFEQSVEDPWEYERVKYIVQDIFRKPPSSPLSKNFEDNKHVDNTDWGNAYRLLQSFPEDQLFYVPQWDNWHVWDAEAGRWQENQSSQLAAHWEDLTIQKIVQATNKEDKEVSKWMFRSRSRDKTSAAIALMRDIAPRKSPDDLNTHAFLLNVQNGVLDLRTGELREARPDDLMTKRTRAEFNPDVRPGLWTRVLNDLVPDKNLQEFLQRVFGYALTGNTDEQKFFYFHGPPASGKSTILATFHHLMGNYAETAGPASFAQTLPSGAAHSDDIAALANARFVYVSEVEENMKLNEAKVSQMTGGGEAVLARRIYQSVFEFHPKFKLFFGANHKYRVTGNANSGVWRRLMLVPFEHVVPEDERDPRLGFRLRTQQVQQEMLLWALEGCMRWHEEHVGGKQMAVPMVVRDEVKQYRQESDHILDFIEDVVRITEDESDRIEKKVLYEIYQGWCQETGRRMPLTKNSFSRRMSDAGFKYKQMQVYVPAKKGKVPRDCWYGIKVTVPIPGMS